MSKTMNTPMPSVSSCHSSQLESAEALLSQSVWPRLEQVQYHTFQRVLEAFLSHRIGEEHFYSVTGYGHDDLGREVCDKVFAQALQAEAALVRVQMVSGTHALHVALNACLTSPQQTLLCLTGQPYDTLEEVIGLRGNNPQSLQAKGIRYQQLSFLENGILDLHLNRDQERMIQDASVAYIQRSRGYSLRPSLTIEEIGHMIQMVKALNPEIIVLVDNCYGEFTETDEPTAVGADLIAGSLIKNPGAGIVPTGGYVAGKSQWVDAAASVLTCPGVGTQGGYTFDLTRTILQGLFLAPGVVKEALKGMTLASFLFEQAGYEVTPHWDDQRSDIIQVIHLQTPDNLVRFCEILQRYSPVNSALRPIPCQIPGYEVDVVMAGGTFIEGSTLELSADGPLRPPYTVFLQGGLTYAHTRYAVLKILEALVES